MNLKQKCQQDDHQDEIDTVCYNQFCTEFRLNCFKCMKKARIHHDHFDDVEKSNTLFGFIENKNKECDNLIDDLNTYLDNLNQSFTLLKRGIRQKYSLLKERSLQLNLSQINDYLNSSVKLMEYKQSITTIISDQTNKLIHTFNNLHQQLKLYFIQQFTFEVFKLRPYHHLIIIRLMIILQKYLKSYMIKVMIYTRNVEIYIIYWKDKYTEAIDIFDISIQQNPDNHLSLWCKGKNASEIIGACL